MFPGRCYRVDELLEGLDVLSLIALKRIRISLRTYRQMPPQDFPAKHFGKPVGILDDDQRLRAL
ncbi:hypothetical protein [Prochlorococcus sp. MIT 0718]|uniref:hypothetical protein n=1 Tax=Prochlorococcus sp. MIT 0718 TaxID=3082539 RepID=UPI0039AFBA66